MLLHGLGFSPPTLLTGFPSLRPTNPARFASPEYDALRANVANSSTDTVAQATKDIAAYIAQQAWSLPLVYAPSEIVITPNLIDVKPSARAYADFKVAYFTK